MLTLHTYSDGGARGNPGPSAIGCVLCDEKGNVIHEASKTIGERTNNQAEYEAMIMTLELAHERRAERLFCHADSELLIYQIQGRYRIKNPQLKVLLEKVKSLTGRFKSISFKQVPREHPMIARADKLLNQTLDRAKGKAPARAPSVETSGQGELF